MALSLLTVPVGGVKIGDRFHRLVVERFAKGKWRAQAVVRCDCGAVKEVDCRHLRTGMVKSCGCWNTEVVKTRCITHGMSVGRRTHGRPQHYLYTHWTSIKGRTSNPNNPSWADYGGRGITMHPAWRDDAAAFAAWIIENLGERPSLGHSLDRIDNDKGYEPGNLRWGTRGQQARNTRRNIWVEVGGERMCLKDACAKLGINRITMLRRITCARRQGYTPQDVVDGTFVTRGWTRRS